MGRSALLFTFLVLTSAVRLFGQVSGISIDNRGISEIQTDSGAGINIALVIRNTSDKALEIASELGMPEGWRVLLTSQMKSIGPTSEDLVLIALYAPIATKAGRYAVRYTAWPEGRPQQSETALVNVVIRESIDIDISLRNASAYVIAGQDIHASFIVANLSNTDIRLDLAAESATGYSTELVEYGEEGMLLASGEAREVNVLVRTDPLLGKLVRHYLTVEARLLRADRKDQEPPITARAEAVTEIFPRVMVSGDRYYRLPLEIELSQANSFAETWSGDGSILLAVDGALDEGRQHLIDVYLFQSIDLPPESFAAADGVYRLGFENDFMAFGLGDQTYSLTPLLEGGAHARGALLSFSPGLFEVGSYYHHELSSSGLEHVMAGYLSLGMPDQATPGENLFRTSVNAIGVLGDTIILSVLQSLNPGSAGLTMISHSLAPIRVSAFLRAI
jgi:hypothetical protein